MRSPTISWRRLALLALLVLVLFLLGACRNRKLIERTETVEHMETRSGVTVRDTLLRIPGAHVSGTVSLPQPMPDVPMHTVRSERAWSSVEVHNGAILHSGGCDSSALAATLFDRWSKESKAQTITHTVDKTVEIVRTPKWAWYALGGCVIGLLKMLWPWIIKLIKFL